MDSNDQTYEEREQFWDEQWPSTEKSGMEHPPAELDTTDELMPFPDSVGTNDVMAAVRDAEPYIPPIDPPVLPGGWDNIHVATGFGTSAEEETARDNMPLDDEDVRELVLLALRQDSLTSHYNLDVTVNDGVVRITGPVSDIEDANHAISMVGDLSGVRDVIDNMTIDGALG